MRAREFIKESRSGSITADVGRALPGAFKIPALKNQDPYLQYRFGVAIAGAKGAKKRAEDNIAPYTKESEFGENEITNDPNKGIPTSACYRFRFTIKDEGLERVRSRASLR